VSIPFQAKPGWRGNALNDDSESDRGWSMELTIPFRSLGLDGPPPQGTLWRLGIITHDRDSFYPSPTPIPPQSWPPDLKIDDPQSWGILHFGLLTYQSTAIRQGTVSIRRESENDLSVPDADVGGVSANQCPGDEDFNIQNQSDVADWPCFSRYYVSFPITMLPPNKKIISATLTLHQFGNAGGSEAKPSWIQVLMTYTPWQEETITWNLAPLAAENLGGSWVYPVQSFDWPGHPRTWDVSYAVAKAYEAGLPAVHLILYEADSAYHSGKFFVSSDTGDWNIEGRPRLDITWGE
jgi:hypothetical protein